MSIVTRLDRVKSRRQELKGNPAEISIWRYWLVVAMLVVGYAVPDHGWKRSLDYADTDSLQYTGSENMTADRLGSINKMSTVCRLTLAVVGVIGFWVQRRFQLCKTTPLLWLSCALGVMLYGSVLWSINPDYTLFKLIVLTCLGLSALGFATCFTLRQLLESIALTCAIFISIGVIAELSLGTFRLGGGHRFTGTTHPNSEAIFGAVLCLCAQLFYRWDRRGLLAIGLFALGAICIVLTKSRTTLAAVMVSFIVMQILAIRGSKRWYLMLGLAFAAGAILFASLLFNQQGAGRLGELVAMGRAENVSSLTGRLPLWEELLTSLWKSPMLGYGYLAFWDAERVEYLSDTLHWEIPHGHNMYLDIALDVGIVGALLFVGWLLSGLARSANLFTRTGKVEYAIVAGIVLCAMINGLAESLFKLPGFPLFILLSTVLGLLHSEAEPDTTTSPVA